MTVADKAATALVRNLGQNSARRLASAGIHTVGDLRAVGSVDTYRR